MNNDTALYGILGHPIGHSLSPRLHNAGFSAVGRTALYLPFDVRPGKLRVAVEGMRALGFRGFNLTVPHKEAVLPLLDEITPTALRLGAVNTVVREEDRLIGDNTDAEGFLRALGDLELVGRRAVVLGSGGAARAVAGALAPAVGELFVCGRDERRRNEMVEGFRGLGATVLAVPWEERESLGNVDLLVNATPLGLKGESSPWEAWEGLNSRASVVDLIYNPPETNFLRRARAAGFSAQNGLEMLLQQAALAWQLWFGEMGPVAAFREGVQHGG